MKISKVIAHRGASGYAPENTMASFELATKMKADGIELDVQVSKDGKLVVFHDEKVDRTTNGSGYIKDLSLSYIKKLDSGSWFSKKFKNEKVPTLDEVLFFFKDKYELINIELKNGIIDYNGIEEKVIKLINDFNISDKTIISSYNHYSLLRLKAIDRNIKIGLLYVANLINPWKYAANLGAYSIHPYFYSVNDKLIYNSNNENIKIITYTVNDIVYIEKLIRLKVDGIITNYPDKAVYIREKY